MRIVAQRVLEAFVEIGEEIVGRIGPGLVLLVGIAPGDGLKECQWMIRKLMHLRLFDNHLGRMDKSLLETGQEVLCISQFTLFADVRKGTSPGFSKAASPEEGAATYALFETELRQALPGRVQSGRFGADMNVHIVNHGPVTIILDSPPVD